MRAREALFVRSGLVEQGGALPDIVHHIFFGARLFPHVAMAKPTGFIRNFVVEEMSGERSVETAVPTAASRVFSLILKRGCDYELKMQLAMALSKSWDLISKEMER